ncbi:type IV pilus biogenesis protein PilM [Legionella hackeliae]|uniref:Type IV pilus assembly protein PilM n=1 Tax=Legionella hackeliae TaxID=449 RepID=A0A0A8UWR9_LEGHA|nr:type IV pilus assembly protein PilM [Legionella hackeliae]KTD15436.1 Tfp pilus assembly protein, ATPase PilM [Legionella hackeliae]CEK11194.1 protein of unknown function [Legionella hackeliae]STX47959.1 type IV pilus assembly protein PilM [Legionella hackeliae]
MFKRLRSRPSLGMDITPSEINILQISHVADNYCIENFASSVLPPHTIVDNQLRDIDAIAHCLKRITMTSSLSGNFVVLAVPDSAIITKTIQIRADLVDAEIEEAIYFELCKYLSYPLHEINMDFVIQGPCAEEKGKLNVQIIACRSEQVSKRVEALKPANLLAKTIEIESSAIERVVPLLEKSRTIQQIAIFKINHLYIQLYVFKENNIVFTHEEKFCSTQWFDPLGWQNCEDPFSHIAPSTKLENIDVIIRQIKKNLQFFYSTQMDCVVEHVFLAGEKELLTKICQRLEDKIKIPVSIANPFKNMEYSSNISFREILEKAPSLLIACGLALRGEV